MSYNSVKEVILTEEPYNLIIVPIPVLICKKKSVFFDILLIIKVY